MARRALVAVAFILVSAGAYSAYRQWRVAANDAKAQEMISEIERQIPLGTPEAQLEEFLRKEYAFYATVPFGGRTEYRVPVGKEPSGVWYCVSSTAYVSLECEGDRFVRSRVTRWSIDCL